MNEKNLLDYMKSETSFELGEVVSDMIRGYFEDSSRPDAGDIGMERWDTAKGKAICVEEYAVPFVQVLIDIEKCKTMGELYDYLTGTMDGVLGTMWDEEFTSELMAKWKKQYKEIMSKKLCEFINERYELDTYVNGDGGVSISVWSTTLQDSYDLEISEREEQRFYEEFIQHQQAEAES